MKRLIQVLTSSLCVFVLAGLVGCPFSTDTRKTDPEPFKPTFLPRTSPKNLLENLKVAYDERDITEYDSLLAGDFTFILSPDDQNIAECFDRQQEIGVHENMFDGELVQTLRLTFDRVMESNIVFDEVKSTLEDPWYTTVIMNVDLFLFGVTPSHPDEPAQGYEMDNGQEQFWFRKNGWTDTEGDSIWTIVEWQEISVGGGGT
ncbi:MAG: hypothetical protein KAY24_14780 [Candidatus Eisenbacteria sp.]|nr:hypothetical protein [Candidatus Eisenbacteria bacterium]